MTDLKRHGSLGFYHNSRRSKRKIVPSLKGLKFYFVKAGMMSDIDPATNELIPVTLLQKIPHQKVDEVNWTIDTTDIRCRNAMKTKLTKEFKLDQSIQTQDQLFEKIKSCEYFDAVSFTKGRGTIGPVARRGLSLGLPGVRRKPGSMGCRTESKIVWTRPFGGKTGFTRRTTYSLKNIGCVDVQNYSSLRYYVKKGTFLKVKGSIGGKIGRIVCLRPSVRKIKKTSHLVNQKTSSLSKL